MTNTKVVFFGTPPYVMPVLDALKNAGYKITCVVTKITSSPVSQWAEKRGIPAIFNIQELLSSRIRYDVGIIAAYGKIIPEKVIDLFPKGILNIHPSLLPCWRGASPIEATIVAGDKKTGVTIIKIDEQMDHGPIVGMQQYSLQGVEKKVELRGKLFEMGADLLVSLLPDFLAGKIKLEGQNHSKATFTTLLKKEHGFISPKYLAAAQEGETLQEKWKIPFIKDYVSVPSPETIVRFIRAVNPWPGAYTLLHQGFGGQAKRLKILKTHVEDGKLFLDTVQLEGKKPVTWKQFVEGYPSHSWT